VLEHLKCPRDPFVESMPPNESRYRGEWQRWFASLVSHKYAIGNAPGVGERRYRTHEEAYELAHGEAVNLWHQKYGQRPDPQTCAGCRKPIGRSNLMALPDGGWVHDDAELRCLISYGEMWRNAAAHALTRT
jgi:hypothetical protein